MSILVGERKEGQSREQWKVDTLGRLAPPDVSLRNYGGHPLNLIAQTPLQLSCGDRTVDATVLIQKEAPNQLLLGTDVLGDLGFSLVGETPGGKINLLPSPQPCHDEEDGTQDSVGPQPPSLAGGPGVSTRPRPIAMTSLGLTEVTSPRPIETTSLGPTEVTSPRPVKTTNPGPAEATMQSSSGPTEVTPHSGSRTDMTREHAQPSTGGPTTSDCLRGSGEGMVHLLTATKIPAGYRKMVRVQLLGDSSPHLVMFTPRSVADQVLFVDAVFAGPCATLVATNKGTQAVHLEAGTTLGTAAPIDEEDIMDGGEDVEGSGGADGGNAIEGDAGG